MPDLTAENIGLSTQEANKRLERYGPNIIISKKQHSPLAEFLLRFKNPLVFILLFAALASAYFGAWISSSIIIAIVLLSTTLDFINTYRSQKAAELLRERVRITATAIRDGKPKELPLALLVTGDAILLSPGDVIPADGEVISSKDFFIDESSLTGESFPVEKITAGKLFMGSSAVSGTAMMLVTSTGKNTKFSKIAEALVKKEEPTDFDRGMKDFSFLILKMTFILVIVIFLINALLHHSILESFLFATALAVGLTPELLPMIITLNLTKGSLAMSRKGVIVKKLSAIQNFGSMDVLCTDKTGTLTEGVITLMKYVDGQGRNSDKVLLDAYLNSFYHTGIKNPLDSAVRKFRTLDISAFKKIDEIPFDNIRKRDSVVVEEEARRILISKGAPEEILKIAVHYEKAIVHFDEVLQKQARLTYEALSRDGFRVLAVATRDIDEVKPLYSKEDERDLVFVGFIAFLDPPKKTVTETLRLMKEHGVEIKILTGDNELVTQKIAADIDLAVKGILRGEEIDEVSDEHLMRQIEQTTIFARMSPDQKLRIIRILRKNNHVVGYLGDGINDAPSLKLADVGISVNNAVDVSKEAADLILVRKSLGNLIDGVIEGRKTFSNTIKYLMMALSSNLGNMFSMAGASLILPFLPMLPTQILLTNLLYDSSQFAIPLDNVDIEDIRTPKKWSIQFIKRFMLVFGPLSSFFDFVTFVTLFYFLRLNGNAFQTGWFLESIATQTLVVHIIRTKHIPFLESKPARALLFSTFIAVALGWLVVFSGVGKLFQFIPLRLKDNLLIFLIVLVYLGTVEFGKRVFYKKITARL